MIRSRRALLYVPGDDWHKAQKAATLDVDSVCLDLEDGVSANRKSEARATVSSALRELPRSRSERLARINSIGSGLELKDLAAILPAHPDGIVVPKVTTNEQVKWVSARIGDAEQDLGWEPGGIRLLVLIETARGVLDLPAIAGADARLDALIFGAEDLAADIGAQRTRAGWEVFHARSAILLTAAAFDLQAIDLLDVDFRNMDRLREEARQGAEMGFAGKQVIHPDQVSIVQEAFTPSDRQIEDALVVVKASERHLAAGSGAFALDGKMVDMPVVKAAEATLARARAAGKLAPL